MAHHHMVEMLDLDAEVLRDYHHEVITWASSLVSDPSRVIDLGAGTGTATLALARHLPSADLIAVDTDANLLEHLYRRATEAGLADRIHTRHADLDNTWPDLEPANLVWASASMHHLADPDRALAKVHAVLRPGGAFVITEVDSFPRFLTDPAGIALEERCHTQLARLRHEAGMHMNEDWGARLTAAGFQIEGQRRFHIELRPPLPPNAVEYAKVSLQRARHRLADHLAPDDLATLDALVATAPNPDDLTVRTTRMVWAGRRPRPGYSSVGDQLSDHLGLSEELYDS